MLPTTLYKNLNNLLIYDCRNSHCEAGSLDDCSPWMMNNQNLHAMFFGSFLLSSGFITTSVSDMNNSSLPSNKNHIWPFSNLVIHGCLMRELHVFPCCKASKFQRFLKGLYVTVMDPKKFSRWVCILRSFASEKLGSTFEVQFDQKKPWLRKGYCSGMKSPVMWGLE